MVEAAREAKEREELGMVEELGVVEEPGVVKQPGVVEEAVVVVVVVAPWNLVLIQVLRPTWRGHLLAPKRLS